MADKVCLRFKKDKNRFICNEEWYLDNQDIIKQQMDNGELKVPCFEVLRKGHIDNMEDLIKYCLAYYYDVEIPKEYKVETLYSIVFCTADFDPDDRTTSTCRSSIIFSSTDKKQVESKFKKLQKDVGKGSRLQSKIYFCWHTEDYAYNQIIHSYNICQSYIITKIK